MSVLCAPPLTGEGPLAAARSVMRRLLESGIASDVLVDVAGEGDGVPQRRLVHEAALLERSLPFAPVILVHGARLASQLTERRPAPADGEAGRAQRCAIVLRPCEARAAVELAKLRQVDLDQLLIIAVDCVGTHEAAARSSLGLDSESWAQQYLAALRRGEAESPFGLPYREACGRCVDPVAPLADLWLHVLGVPDELDLVIEVARPELAEQLELTPFPAAPELDPAVSRLRSAREGARARQLDQALEALQPGEGGAPGLAAQFDSCLRCLNCGTACPICYCKECLFRTDSMRVECRHLHDLAERRGAVRLPGDAIIYQLTRLMHVSTSCVGCGLCTSACPMDLPVDRLFQAVGRETQNLLSYRPGADRQSLIPTSTFGREEFGGLGDH